MTRIEGNWVRKVRKIQDEHDNENQPGALFAENGPAVIEANDAANAARTRGAASPGMVDAGREPQVQQVLEPLAKSVPVRLQARSRSELDPEFIQEATKLVFRLFRTPGEIGLRSVLFCGVDQAANSSEVCCRTAEVLAAQIQKSVCVVDADFRQPSVHRQFGLENRRGLSDAILQPGPVREFAQQCASGNLWAVTGGTVPDEGVLSHSEQLRSRMLELRTVFDYVLVNVAPAGLFLDAVVVGQHVEGAVLVIESKSTRRETAFHAKQALESANIRILGAVLHGRAAPAAK